MPSSPLVFRASCGCFFPVFLTFMCKRVVECVAMRVSTLVPRDRATGVLLGFVLVYLFWGGLLMQAGDIESNPGPAPGSSSKQDGISNMRQTRLNSAAGATGGRPSMDKTSHNASAPSQSGEKELSLKDVMATLLSMDHKFDQVKNDVKEMKEVYACLKDELLDVKNEVADLRRENDSLRTENAALKERVEGIERRTDDLEDRSKRQNIIIHGLPRDTHEKTWQDCEDRVRDLIVDRLELTGEMPFDRVHRLTSDSNSPIVARCTFFKDKQQIMRAKGKLKGTKIFIGDDYSKRVRDVRKRLAPHLKTARSQGKKVNMVFDHLVIDGKKHCVNDSDQLYECK